MTDGNLYALRQYEAQQDAEDQQQERLNAAANDLRLEMVHSQGDFQEAVFKALESWELITTLHEQFVEGRRKDVGIEFCEKIDEAMADMAMELAKGEME